MAEECAELRLIEEANTQLQSHNYTKLAQLSKELDHFKKYLALDFEISPGGLKFIFTNIDIKQPQRAFTISLYFDDWNNYHVIECTPPIESLKPMTNDPMYVFMNSIGVSGNDVNLEMNKILGQECLSRLEELKKRVNNASPPLNLQSLSKILPLFANNDLQQSLGQPIDTSIVTEIWLIQIQFQRYFTLAIQHLMMRCWCFQFYLHYIKQGLLVLKSP
eukprot:gene1103-1256_t